MIYKEFAIKATIDKRNLFAPYDGDLSCCPVGIRDFYKTFNPIKVEVKYGVAIVRFAPAEKLIELQDRYSYLNADFVFATCNGDPIFIKDNIVYICPHDDENPEFEKLADSFDKYLKIYVKKET
jgi:hypothetical protein